MLMILTTAGADTLLRAAALSAHGAGIEVNGAAAGQRGARERPWTTTGRLGGP
jgi:hypothetical protein